MAKGNYKTIKRLARTALESNLSVLILGHPGVGKSTMARELAQEFNLPLIEIRLAHVDPSELVGVQMPDKDTRKLVWYVPEWVPVDKPAFVFLDEINAGVTKLHQAAAYQIVLDRRAGAATFHPETKIMAAGNLEEDNAIVTPLSQALNNRFVHFQLEPEVETWLEWAAKAGISPLTRAFIHFRGLQALYNNTGEAAFPTPRSVAMADKLYQAAKQNKMKKYEIKQLIASTIGEGMAVQFVEFEELYSAIDLDRAVKTGEINTSSRETSFYYALAYGASTYVREKFTAKDIDKYYNGIITLLKKIPQEYITLFLKETSLKKATFDRLASFLSRDPVFSRILDEILTSIAEFEV